MYEIKVLNLETKKSFIRLFESEYSFRKFFNRCTHNKKVRVLSYWKNY